jgi:catechol 2,3-dioxygenase-like lactoylglutathione lyase family enzyme
MRMTTPPTNVQHPPRPDGWEREIYPMPSFPLLLVSDLERSSRWYQETLGFVDVFTFRNHDGTPFIAHLRWSLWADVLLVPQREAIDGPRGVGITLNFGGMEVDALAERVRAAGATILEGPVDRPWNARDLVVLDPDGYRLTFTAPAKRSRESFDDMVARLQSTPPTSG